MIAMIDDSKLDDRANCFESIGFHMAQLGKPPVRRFHSRHLLFAVALMGVAPLPPRACPNCRIPVDLLQLVLVANHIQFSSPVINLANRITAHVTWTLGQSSRCRVS